VSRLPVRPARGASLAACGVAASSPHSFCYPSLPSLLPAALYRYYARPIRCPLPTTTSPSLPATAAHPGSPLTQGTHVPRRRVVPPLRYTDELAPCLLPSRSVSPRTLFFSLFASPPSLVLLRYRLFSCSTWLRVCRRLRSGLQNQQSRVRGVCESLN
jgi:hypothetical protein